MKSVAYAVLTMAMVVAMASGCGPGKVQTQEAAPSPAKPAPAQSNGTVGLSVLTMNNPFFKVIADSMTAALAKEGYEVLAVSGDFDVAKQQNQIKDFIVKKVSAIVLCPCNSKSIGPAIKEANAAGIPVFTADIACLDPEAKVVSHIATDNFQG
ncbi:MAG: ribose transport system substrate-binding protein, partial [Candidatus Hydrogenedentes bacterium]|nr:ribose transport system substrate-binding protein [Candidatus Hydrogenedentota bacterium]